MCFQIFCSSHVLCLFVPGVYVIKIIIIIAVESIPSSYGSSLRIIASFSIYRAFADGSLPSLYFCAAAAHLIDVFVTLDMVNFEEKNREIMLVVCCNPLFTNLYLQYGRAYGSFG